MISLSNSLSIIRQSTFLFKDLSCVALVWAVSAKIFDFDVIFPFTVFLITLPLALLYLFKKREFHSIRSEGYSNETVLRLMAFVNNRTRAGVQRMAANKFAASLLHEGIATSFVVDGNKSILHFKNERCLYKDKKWIIIPSMIAFTLFPTGEFEFYPDLAPKEVRYTSFIRSQVWLWKKAYPGREGTFTVEAQLSPFEKKDIQYSYKDLL